MGLDGDFTAAVELLESRLLLSAGTLTFTAGTSATFLDANGDAVTISLTGPGAGAVHFADGAGDFADAVGIDLVGTTKASTLKVAVKGDGVTSVQNLTVDGQLKALLASEMTLTGSINSTGVIGNLTLGDVRGPATIDVQTGAITAARRGMNITMDDVTDLSVDTHGMPVASLTVTNWTQGSGDNTFAAPWIGKLIAVGDFQANLSLYGHPSAKPSLGKARIGYDFSDATWMLNGSLGRLAVAGGANRVTVRTGGDQGVIHVGYASEANFLAGVSDSVTRPDRVEYFVSQARIHSFRTTGVTGHVASPAMLFDNSVLVAATVGRVALRDANPTNTGIYVLGDTGKEIKSVSVHDTVSGLTTNYPSWRMFAAMPLNFVTTYSSPPVAAAGPDSDVYPGDVVTLGGLGSFDADGPLAEYHWEQVGGTVVALDDTESATPHFTAPPTTAPTLLGFMLTVTDSLGDTSQDTVVVRVEPGNLPPVVNAGADFAVDEQSTVNLSATAIDPENGPMTYQWQQLSGPAVTLHNTKTLSTYFTAPPTTTGTAVVLSLTVTDDQGLATTDTVRVTINHSNDVPAITSLAADAINPVTVETYAPANATPNGNGVTAPLNAYEGRSVQLTASGTDGGHGPLQYAWTQVGGKSVGAITDANRATASFTIPTIARDLDGDVLESVLQNTLVFRLTVTNNLGLIATKNVTVRARLLGDVNRDDIIQGQPGEGDNQQADDNLLSNNWELYDLNGDGDVTMLDTGIIAANDGDQLL